MSSNDTRNTTSASSTSVWPWLLIAAGVLLVLGNLGWFSWMTLLSYASLLPLLLVAVGMDMILRGRHRAIVVLGTVAVAAFLVGVGPRWGYGAVPEPQTIAQGLQGARRAEVRLETGVSRVELRSSARADQLVEGVIHPRRGERIDRSFSAAGGWARFAAVSQGTSFGGMFGDRGGGTWDLVLGGRVPLALQVRTGVGHATMDLSELRLERLSLDTGVGAVNLTLPRSGRFEADLDTGVGSVTVRLPRSLAARVTVDRGVGSVSVPAGFSRDGDVYHSPGYASATDRVDLKLNSGVGSVNIVHVD